MTTLVVQPSAVSGEATVPGTKSIAHRALMLAATARGTSRITGIPQGEDVISTIRCLRAFGVDIERGVVESRGIESWRSPGTVLDCGNSGTTVRTLAGLAARLSFTATFDGDESLRRRPMDRVAVPLRELGAYVETTSGSLPMRIEGGDLVGSDISLEVPSAQVKTAVMFAGLGARGRTFVTEPFSSRDHTERMLRGLGAPLMEEVLDGGAHRVTVQAFEIPAFDCRVPGDFSSAAFLLAAAALTGDVRVNDVGLNPTRTRFFGALVEMCAQGEKLVLGDSLGEPIGSVAISRSELKGVTVDGSDPQIQDELPLIALLATQADGETEVKGARELRVKESDRIDSVVRGLRSLGADIHELVDGFVVRGPTKLRGTTVDSAGDHRIAMTLAVAGLVAEGETRVEGFECAAVSWPGFERVLADLGAEVRVA